MQPSPMRQSANVRSSHPCHLRLAATYLRRLQLLPGRALRHHLLLAQPPLTSPPACLPLAWGQAPCCQGHHLLVLRRCLPHLALPLQPLPLNAGSQSPQCRSFLFGCLRVRSAPTSHSCRPPSQRPRRSLPLIRPQLTPHRSQQWHLALRRHARCSSSHSWLDCRCPLGSCSSSARVRLASRRQ